MATACGAIACVVLGLFAGSSGASLSDYSGSLYLTKTASGIGSGTWQLVTSAPAAVDSSTQNRVNTGVTGYALFTPGAAPASTLTNTTTTASISPANCTGWIVDGTGGMAFAAGTWTFQATVEDPLNANGQAKLTGALYAVDASGAIAGTVVAPTDSVATLIRNAGAVTTTASISGAGSAVSLGSAQHLCLMLWRHQTTAYTSGGGATRLFKLDVNDGTAAITSAPAANGYPTVALASGPADAAYVKSGDTLTLGATYGDPDSPPVAGTVVIQVCPTAACGSVQAQQSFASVASGSTVTWSPTLPDGTWYWRASASDGTTTVWSSARSFTLDTTVPSVPSLVAPAAGVTTNSLALTATFSDPAVADTGFVNVRLCNDALCTSVVTSGSSSSVMNGSNGTWTVSPAPADGLYYWQAQNADIAGNRSAWSGSRAVTFDRTAPTTTIDSAPGTYATSASATFTFHASEAATFECNLDAAGWGTACSSPKAYSALADGSHSLQIRATDAAGNVGTAATSAWTVDTTVPATPPLGSPADGFLTNTIPQLAATFSDPTAGDSGTVDFRICTAAAPAGSQCSSVVTSGSSASVASGSSATWTPSSLADGTYDWQARAHDTAGNASGWSATRTFTLDSTAPDTTITTMPPTASNSTGASFSFTSTEPASTFTCSFDGGSYSACTSPASYSSLAEGVHTFSVRATDSAANTDASPATRIWTVDTTAPDTTIGPTQPSALEPSSSATFDLAATEPATFECKLDTGSWTVCTTPKTYTTLAEGSHTFQTRATDAAGNVDATPATKTWFADTTVPAAAMTTPADLTSTNAVPHLSATFTDPSSSDTGAVDFRLCAVAASAGSACGSLLQSSTSPVVTSGASVAYTPSALGDGHYFWQVRAHDAAGNASAWTATRAFTLDTLVPDVPLLDSPASETWVRSMTLRATFSDPGFGSTGTVEFRVCSDALCLGVQRDGSSGIVTTGEVAAWSPSNVGDGYWWWDARAHDAAGNVSAWSAPRGFNVDATPPSAPTNFNGQLAADGLTLRWDPPQDAIANFVLFVNGDSGPYLGEKTYEYKVGTFDANDARTFSVAAVDKAGNMGARSGVLVGVPNLVGLTLTQADAAVAARGFVLRRTAGGRHAAGGVVVSQDPVAASLHGKGSVVHVVVKPAKRGSAIQLAASPARVSCAPGSLLKLHVALSRVALVRTRVLGAHGRLLAARTLGLLHAGDNRVSVRLPSRYRGTVHVVLDAGGSARAVVTVAPRKHSCSAG